ncbi:hypothetical protein ARMSODRAFT_1090516 [Armillaria solidipes]|uniref:Uncharacterized protein n=1 Tax=Armillaria solidipes TaxID=1076256 RepID=A0A2H3AMP0_9AGAR|nr:hypothetical protein ARMSODRAFT_1090516 [Armillaria solidipes]
MQTSACPQHTSDIDLRVPVHDNRHRLSTFAVYRAKYPEGEYETVFDFVQGVYAGEGAETIINVWGEPEVFMSTYTVLPTPPPPPRNDTGLKSTVGKAQRREKDKLAWKFERYDVAFTFLIRQIHRAYHKSKGIVGRREPRVPVLSSQAHMDNGGVSPFLRDTMHVRVCKFWDVDAMIATTTSSLTWPSCSGDVVDLSSEGYAAEMKKMLSLL